MMGGRRVLTRDNWNKESYDLITYIMQNAVSQSIVRSLSYLLENQRNTLGRVLLYRIYEGREVSAFTYRLLYLVYYNIIHLFSFC